LLKLASWGIWARQHMTAALEESPRRSPHLASRVGLALAIAAAAIGAATWLFRQSGSPPPRRPLTHQAYVWQRVWRPEISEALRTAVHDIESFSLLSAEMQWKNGAPEIRRFTPDWATLRELKKPPGIVIRVFPSVAATAWNSPATDALLGLIGQLMDDFRANTVPVRDVQLDYDCPESKLGDFIRLVRELKQRHPQLSLSITALPAWLTRKEFATLAGEIPGYVLQVHSLHLPQSRSGLVTLCDPAAARAAVQRAGALKIPFRVALPTYSCVVTFDAAGKVTEVYGEDLPSSFPQTADPFIVMDADAFQCAALVSEWQKTGPAELKSVVWYRLPVKSDRLNWPWPTLAKVCRGEVLRRGWKIETPLQVSSHRDIVLHNDGDAPDDLPRVVVVRAQDGGIAASDGLRGYAATPQPDGRVRWLLENPSMHPRVPPGGQRIIGWCRTADEKVDVVTHMISP
jgi:hypothetical protein